VGCSGQHSPFVLPPERASGFLRAKQVVKNIVQRPALGLDNSEWLGVWDSLGKYIGQWAPPVSLKLTPEQVQNPDKLVKYLQKVCCHPGNSRETQITAKCWSLAHAYQALFNTDKCLKEESRGNEAAGTVTGAAPQPALQPLQPSRQSQTPRPATPLPLPQMHGLPRFPQWAQQMLQPQLQLQASRLSPMTKLCL